MEKENNSGAHKKILVILLLTAAAAWIYAAALFHAYPIFESTRLTDALAEINSLVPLHYIAIALSALSIVACLIWHTGGKWLHLLLLTLFAVMLWLTPYCLAGFMRLGDSAWHTGVAMQVPQVLNGEHVTFSGYGWDYPASYIYHYSFVNILGVQPLTYITFFPLVALLLFVLLSYLLLARLSGTRAALLAMLLAIPGLHYLQLHTSPHAIGALLMLTALLMLIQRGAAKIIPIVVILVITIIITHPTTPLLISIFLAAALIISVIYSRKFGRIQLALAGIIVICLAGWFSWYSFHPDSRWKSAGDLYESIWGGGFEVGKEYLAGTPFIYASIYKLNRAIYFLYAAAALMGILYILGRTYLEKRSIGKWLSQLGGINRIEACMALSTLPLIILTFLLAEKAHDLIETGLTYIILALSFIIASVIVRSGLANRKSGAYLLVVGVLFLALSFPVVAYSIDAYSSYPKSEANGLQFLAEEVPLDGKIVVGSNLEQLALYLEYSPTDTKFLLLRLNKGEGDIAVFRNTGYYYAAMRFELSFEDNGYTRYLAKVENEKYDRIYSSPTFDIYSR